MGRLELIASEGHQICQASQLTTESIRIEGTVVVHEITKNHRRREAIPFDVITRINFCWDIRSWWYRRRMHSSRMRQARGRLSPQSEQQRRRTWTSSVPRQGVCMLFNKCLGIFCWIPFDHSWMNEPELRHTLSGIGRISLPWECCNSQELQGLIVDEAVVCKAYLDTSINRRNAIFLNCRKHDCITLHWFTACRRK